MRASYYDLLGLEPVELEGERALHRALGAIAVGAGTPSGLRSRLSP